jgi:hypothetical protein
MAQGKTKENYDKKHEEEPDLKEGDKVWLDAKNVTTTAPSKKLADKRLGPFKISKKLSPLTFELEMPTKYGRIHNVFHINLLHPYKEDKIEGRKATRPPPIEIEGEEEYEVEKILDGRMAGKKKTYYVKWKGWEEVHNTWEPIDNLGNAQEAINHFHNKNPRFSWKTSKRPSRISQVKS